jgi:hypothetical protein
MILLFIRFDTGRNWYIYLKKPGTELVYLQITFLILGRNSDAAARILPHNHMCFDDFDASEQYQLQLNFPTVY